MKRFRFAAAALLLGGLCLVLGLGPTPEAQAAKPALVADAVQARSAPFSAVVAPNLKITISGKSLSLTPQFADRTPHRWRSPIVISGGKAVATLDFSVNGEIESATYEITIGGGVEPGPTPDPTPTPTPVPTNPYTPTEAHKVAVAPVQAVSMSRTDASNLAAVYSGLGKEAAAYPTTADLRKAIVERGSAIGIKGKYPGLPEAMDKALTALFGLEIVALDKTATAAKLETLAWAVWGVGK